MMTQQLTGHKSNRSESSDSKNSWVYNCVISNFVNYRFMYCLHLTRCAIKKFMLCYQGTIAEATVVPMLNEGSFPKMGVIVFRVLFFLFLGEAKK